jgi:hypothetical protein
MLNVKGKFLTVLNRHHNKKSECKIPLLLNLGIRCRGKWSASRSDLYKYERKPFDISIG